MGFIDRHPCLAVRQMTASDYIWLATLGCAARGPIGIDDVGQAIAALAGPLWSPSGQVVFDSVEAILDRGLLLGDAAGDRLSITDSGRRQLSFLLTLPVPSPLSAFGQVGIRLKMAFIDILPPALMRHQIVGVIHAYECEVANRSVRCQAWPLNGSIGRKWLDHQVDTLEDGLALLRQMIRPEPPTPCPGS
ncbi:MAG: hypothetical protein Q7R40_07725 [Phaeospirillum sp.]|nr:hypothetical protein [Phaeospirillum sp.]